MKKQNKDWRHMRRAITFGLARGAATTVGGLIVTAFVWWVQQKG
ncbi:hypothetical protein ACFC96_43800 [Streptomyces sp. NPDC055955]